MKISGVVNKMIFFLIFELIDVDKKKKKINYRFKCKKKKNKNKNKKNCLYRVIH